MCIRVTSSPAFLSKNITTSLATIKTKKSNFKYLTNTYQDNLARLHFGHSLLIQLGQTIRTKETNIHTHLFLNLGCHNFQTIMVIRPDHMNTDSETKPWKMRTRSVSNVWIRLDVYILLRTKTWKRKWCRSYLMFILHLYQSRKSAHVDTIGRKRLAEVWSVAMRDMKSFRENCIGVICKLAPQFQTQDYAVKFKDDHNTSRSSCGLMVSTYHYDSDLSIFAERLTRTK